MEDSWRGSAQRHTALLFASPRDHSKAQAIRESMAQAQGDSKKKRFLETAANEVVKLHLGAGHADSKLLEQEINWGVRRVHDAPCVQSSIHEVLGFADACGRSSSQRSGRITPSSPRSRTGRAVSGKQCSWAHSEKLVRYQPGTPAQPPRFSPTLPAKATEKNQLLASGKDKRQGASCVSTPRQTPAATPLPEQNAALQPEAIPATHVRRVSVERQAEVKAVLSDMQTPAVTLVLPSSGELTKPGELRPPDEKLASDVEAWSKTWWKRAISQKRGQRAEVRARNSNERPGPAGVTYVPRGTLVPLSPAALRKVLTSQSNSLAGSDKTT